MTELPQVETHIPKGSMCCNCIHGSRDCSFLDFAAMKVVKTYPDGVKVVICEARE